MKCIWTADTPFGSVGISKEWPSGGRGFMLVWNGCGVSKGFDTKAQARIALVNWLSNLKALRVRELTAKIRKIEAFDPSTLLERK